LKKCLTKKNSVGILYDNEFESYKRRGRYRIYSTSICKEQKRLDSFEDCDIQNTVTVCTYGDK
jgi:hypothetical protein